MKKTSFLLFVLLSLYLQSMSQENHVPLWPGGQVPNSQQSADKEKTEVRDILRISLVQQPDIAVFLPSRKNATGQGVIVCPGGGYGVLAYDWEGTDIAKWLNAHGIAAFVLKYRLPNSKSNVVPHKSPLLDAQRALRMVRFDAEKYNIKKDKIGIMGFSAGGHLASTAGTHFDMGNSSSKDSIEQQSSRPDFMILMYPVISMSKPYMHSGSRDNLIGKNPTQELAEYYSNDLQVKDNTPPTLLVHATDDAGVPVENSLSFYQALKNHKVPAEMHIYPYGGHGFSLAVGKGYLSTWTDRCIDWLKSLNK